jgi:predicted tellurium resistance membrane protein TerC
VNWAQLTDPQILLSLAALAALEIVLGIDNIVFIAIMVQRVPEASRKLAYRLGLGAALITRLLLLFTLSWIMGLKDDLFTILQHGISGRDLIMIIGGSFLIFKSSTEIFHKVEDRDEDEEEGGEKGSLLSIVMQIMIIDIVFSLDSVITAVGIAEHLWVMATAMILAVAVMMIFAKSVGDFVTKHPSMQILALSFLLLIGVLLVADGFGQHVSKAYVYFAMGFSLLVEIFNMRQRGKARAKRRAIRDEETAPAAAGVGED